MNPYQELLINGAAELMVQDERVTACMALELASNAFYCALGVLFNFYEKDRLYMVPRETV